MSHCLVSGLCKPTHAAQNNDEKKKKKKKQKNPKKQKKKKPWAKILGELEPEQRFSNTAETFIIHKLHAWVM